MPVRDSSFDMCTLSNWPSRSQMVGRDDRQALPKLPRQESQPECVKGSFLKKAELS